LAGASVPVSAALIAEEARTASSAVSHRDPSLRFVDSARGIRMTESTTIEQFGAEAKAFLDANLEARGEEKFVWGEGDDSVGVLDEQTPEEERAELAAAKAWKAKEFDAGFGWITGPEEYGGRAL